MSNCCQFKRQMHNLAAKFVRNTAAVHVVDPNVDFRAVFKDLPALERNLKNRAIDLNAGEVAKDYGRWWAAFAKHSMEKSEGSEKQKNRAALLDASEGLLSALRVPNVVHQDCIQAEKRNVDSSTPPHMNWLKRRGMVSADQKNRLLHLVGLPVILQNRFVSALEELFSTHGSTRVSAPYVIRAAIVEAFNVSKEKFPAFSSDNSQPLHLAGVCPLTLGALFTRSMFSASNTWPLSFYSSGMTYPHDDSTNNSSSLYSSHQKLNTVLLLMSKTEIESENAVARIQSAVAELLRKQLMLDLPLTTCHASELHSYEMLAKVISNGRADLVRFAKTGTYLSNRLNIVAEIEGIATPVHMDFVEIDVNALLGTLIETFLADGSRKGELPPLLSDCQQYM